MDAPPVMGAEEDEMSSSAGQQQGDANLRAPTIRAGRLSHGYTVRDHPGVFPLSPPQFSPRLRDREAYDYVFISYNDILIANVDDLSEGLLKETEEENKVLHFVYSFKQQARAEEQRRGS